MSSNTAKAHLLVLKRLEIETNTLQPMCGVLIWFSQTLFLPSQWNLKLNFNNCSKKHFLFFTIFNQLKWRMTDFSINHSLYLTPHCSGTSFLIRNQAGSLVLPTGGDIKPWIIIVWDECEIMSERKWPSRWMFASWTQYSTTEAARDVKCSCRCHYVKCPLSCACESLALLWQRPCWWIVPAGPS